MVKKITQISTYVLSLHDLKDDLRVNAKRVLEVVLLAQGAEFDDPIIKIVIEEEIDESED